jgi:hypothetical protein
MRAVGDFSIMSENRYCPRCLRIIRLLSRGGIPDRDRPALLKISQDYATGGGSGQVLESVPAQNGASRIDCAIIELE